jgi:hypothetical protein
MRSHNRDDDNMNLYHHVNLKFCMLMQLLFLSCVQQNPTNKVVFLDPFCELFLLPSSYDG